MLREELLVDPIDLSSLEMTHYRLNKIREQELKLAEGEEKKLKEAGDLGSGTGRDREKERLSRIIARLNELFAGESLTDKDRINYLHTIKDKVMENHGVVEQLRKNAPDQIMLGDFPGAVQDAVMESMESHTNLASQLLREPELGREFASLLLDVLLHEQINQQASSSQ